MHLPTARHGRTPHIGAGPSRIQAALCSAKLGATIIRHVLTADKPIHEILISGIAKFHNDIVDRGREPGIVNERKPKSVDLLVTVIVAERYDLAPTNASTIAAIGSTGVATLRVSFSA